MYIYTYIYIQATLRNPLYNLIRSHEYCRIKYIICRARAFAFHEHERKAAAMFSQNASTPLEF